MRTFHFNKESEILIYGYGAVGRNLHQKLTRHGYRIVGIIDRNAKRLGPVHNCIFIEPEELDAESAGRVIVLTLQSILEHERVVKLLAAKGAENIVYLDRSGGPETYQTCFRIYNQLLYGAATEDFEFPCTAVGAECVPGHYFREETESVIIEVPAPLLFTSADQPIWQNINIASCREYNALFDILLRGQHDFPEDFESYCDIVCGSARSVEAYLQDRLLLFQMLQSEYMNYGLTFFRNAPSTAKWNQEKGYFNISDGLHRASFLFNKYVNTIPIRLSKGDHELWCNSAAVEKCRMYIDDHHIQRTYTPIHHPAFCSLDHSAEKGGRLAASALYQFFGNKDVSGMRIIDLNSCLSYFAQVFARMGASRVVSVERRKYPFELAKLLNQLHHIDNIEMRNDAVEELEMHDRYDVVVVANDCSPSLQEGDAGVQLLRQIDSLSSAYFIRRARAGTDDETSYVLANSGFKSYRRLSVEVIDGALSEVGVYGK